MLNSTDKPPFSLPVAGAGAGVSNGNPAEASARDEIPPPPPYPRSEQVAPATAFQSPPPKTRSLQPPKTVQQQRTHRQTSSSLLSSSSSTTANTANATHTTTTTVTPGERKHAPSTADSTPQVPQTVKKDTAPHTGNPGQPSRTPPLSGRRESKATLDAAPTSQTDPHLSSSANRTLFHLPTPAHEPSALSANRTDLKYERPEPPVFATIDIHADDSDSELAQNLETLLGWSEPQDNGECLDPRFVASFLTENRDHANSLVAYAASKAVSLDTKSKDPLALPPTTHLRELRDLHDRFVTLPSKEAPNELRTLSTLRVLIAKDVTTTELPDLVHEGRVRDFWRKLASMMTVWAGGFGLGGGAAVLGSQHPYFDSKAAGLSADESFVMKRANTATNYAVSNAIIGAGGEMAATVVREGGMDMVYNQAVGRDSKGARIKFSDSAEGRAIYRKTFYGFPVGHGLVDGILKDADPILQAKMRMISSPCAAFAGAIYRAYNELNATEVDVLWLDASTPEKAATCMRSIDDLRKPRPEAIKGYFTDNVWEGIKGLVHDEDGYGLPGADALLRALVRTLVISTLQSGRLVTALVPGEWAWLGNEVTDLMIGSWGETNRLPQMAVDRVVAGSARQKARSQPLPVNQVVPPGLRRRHPVAGNPGDLG